MRARLARVLAELGDGRHRPRRPGGAGPVARTPDRPGGHRRDDARAGRSRACSRRSGRDELLRSTPVVLLSARAGSEAAVGAIDAGADDYVVKPFTHRGAAGPVPHQPRARRVQPATAAASRVRSALLAGVSHDMQTPLAVISSTPGAAERRRHVRGRGPAHRHASTGAHPAAHPAGHPVPRLVAPEHEPAAADPRGQRTTCGDLAEHVASEHDAGPRHRRPAPDPGCRATASAPSRSCTTSWTTRPGSPGHRCRSTSTLRRGHAGCARGRRRSR